MFIRGIIKQMRALLLIMSSILRLRWVLFYNNPPVGLILFPILWKQFLIKGSKAASTLLYFYLLIQDAGIYLSSALCCHFFDWVFESGNRKKPYTAAGSAFGSKVPFFFFTHIWEAQHSWTHWFIQLHCFRVTDGTVNPSIHSSMMGYSSP